MKKKIYILPFVVFIILVISACVDRHKSEQLLDAAELLMESRPDSAFTMLSSVCASPDSLPKALRMRLELLKAKAQNKMFVPFTTDSTMAAVAEWYDRHGNRSQRMTAHYLLGCVYRDLNDAPMALDQYHEAVSLADTQPVIATGIHSAGYTDRWEHCSTKWALRNMNLKSGRTLMQPP